VELCGGFSDDVFVATNKNQAGKRYLVRYCQKQNVINSGANALYIFYIFLHSSLFIDSLIFYSIIFM